MALTPPMQTVLGRDSKGEGRRGVAGVVTAAHPSASSIAANKTIAGIAGTAAMNGMGVPLRATIVITTKNRKSELATALRSATLQVPKAEVIVIDDGSTDGTAEMVRAEYPEVIVRRHDTSLGYIVRRNEGAAMATGDVVVSIDDDAEFTAPDTVAKTLSEFSSSLIGAVAIPYIDVRKSDRVHQKALEPSAIWIAYSYIGTAHAVRKDIFLAVGGYREDLVHQGEEMDFCARMLDAGRPSGERAPDPSSRVRAT